MVHFDGCSSLDFSKTSEVLSGFSGEKFLSCLRDLAVRFVDENNCYLEVGVFQGLTLLNVANEIKKHKVYGVDNYAFFDPQKENLSIVEERIKKLELENVQLLNMDYEQAFRNFNDYVSEKIGLYFIDGPHDYRSQLMYLLYAIPHMADESVIIVDDCNYRHVRQANYDFLVTHPEYKLAFQAYSPAHPNNKTKEELKSSKAGWWNGINILVRDKENVLDVMYPPINEDKSLFVNDHTLQAIKHPRNIPKFIPLINILSGIMNKKWKPEESFNGEFDKLNTFSRDLTKGELNSKLTSH